MKQFNAAVEATDILAHRARLGMLYDLRNAMLGARGDKEGFDAFKSHLASLNKARKRGR